MTTDEENARLFEEAHRKRIEIQKSLHEAAYGNRQKPARKESFFEPLLNAIKSLFK